eukprot:RCo014493
MDSSSRPEGRSADIQEERLAIGCALRASPWYKLHPSSGEEVPGPRTKLSAVNWKDRLLFFGGGHRREFLSDLYEYNCLTSRWRCVVTTMAPTAALTTPTSAAEGQGAGGPPQITPPCARRSHSCVVVQDKMLVFGGRTHKGHLNDLYELDLRTYTWRMIHPSVTAIATFLQGGGGGDLASLKVFVASSPYLSANIRLGSGAEVRELLAL